MASSYGANCKMCQMFQIFTMCNSTTREHSVRFRKQFSRVISCSFSFANRCIDVWNNFDIHTVIAPSLD